MTKTTARRIAYGLAPVAAIAIAYLSTRDRSEAPVTAQQPKTPPSATSRTVMLTSEEARRIGVTYAVASFAPLAREIRTVGQVTYDETRARAVSLKIDGWVENLYVNFTGQAVAAGSPLLSIYSPMLVTAQEELLLAKRLQSDVAAGASDARDNASSLLESARRRLAYWGVPSGDVARIERSGQIQRTITLRSPVGGFVVEKNVLQGQRVMAGEPLYKITDLGTVWVEGEVFERDLALIRLGQEVRAELDALAGRMRSGRITYVYPTVNPETRTVRIRVQLANPGFELKPGMYATLTWNGSAVPALSVPRTAVLATGQRNIVFVKRSDGMLEPRIVAIGSSAGDRVEILSGLTAGETVVKSATFLVDAESNLGTLFGGMGNMPGMDITAPTKEETSAHANH